MTVLDITGHPNGVALAFTDPERPDFYELIAVFDSLAQAAAAKRAAERLSNLIVEIAS